MATNNPFTLVVLGQEETPELKALSDAGHTLIYCDSINFNLPGIEGTVKVDKVVGPSCWRLLPDQHKWIPLMAKEMRALQPKVKKAKKSD